MKTKKRINAASLLATASLAFSSPAWSLGLGEVTVESFLNQPLQVKIDLVTRESDDLTTVSARLASASDYELIGANRNSVPVPIGFSVEDIDGDAYILATSSLPIGVPVVRLIVEVNWSSGRLLREYTIFLDPPVFSGPAPMPRIDKRTSPGAPVATKPSAASQPAAATNAPAEESGSTVGAKPAAMPAEGEYGPVSDGETLWGIASNWASGTGLDINQVMIAIQRENPRAFMKDNINLLKRGAILRMPQLEDVRAISTATAISEVSEQAREFQGGGSVPPVVSPSAPLIAEETAMPAQAEQTIDSEVSALEEDASKAEAQAEELVAEELMDEELGLSPQLELVPPSEEGDLDSASGFEESGEPGAEASVAISALREDLARTEEDLVTQQQQNEYLQQRIDELESQLEEAEAGGVEDADMASMEQRLREQRRAKAAEEKAADRPWYGGFTAWLIGLLVLVAAVGGWLYRRRRADAEFLAAQEEERLREIKGEAEDVLRVLEDSDEEAAGADETGDDVPEPASEESATEEPEKRSRGAKSFVSGSGDAEVLDEESSDPEIQLDLARAYISMGDKEAARVILEEVGVNGNEEQQAEARKMLNHLSP